MNKKCKKNKFINPDYYSFVVVQDLNERNDIPCKLRQDGMIAVVVEEGYAQYQLQTGLTQSKCENSSWVLVEENDVSSGLWDFSEIIPEQID